MTKSKDYFDQEVKKLDAFYRRLETKVKDLDKEANEMHATLSRIVAHQNKHISKLYDLIYALADPSNTRDLMYAAESLQAVHEKEAEEIFPTHPAGEAIESL